MHPIPQDKVILVSMPGHILKQIAENGVSLWPKYEGRWPNFSGLKFSFDPNLPSGTDRVFAAFNLLKNKDDYESIINLQGDMPLIDYKTIKSANIPLHHGYDIGTIATDISSEEIKNENITKVSVDWKEEGFVGDGLDFYKLLNLALNWGLMKTWQC